MSSSAAHRAAFHNAIEQLLKERLDARQVEAIPRRSPYFDGSLSS